MIDTDTSGTTLPEKINKDTGITAAGRYQIENFRLGSILLRVGIARRVEERTYHAAHIILQRGEVTRTNRILPIKKLILNPRRTKVMPGTLPNDRPSALSVRTY